MKFKENIATAMGRSQMNMSKMGSSKIIGGKASAGKNMPASKPSNH